MAKKESRFLVELSQGLATFYTSSHGHTPDLLVDQINQMRDEMVKNGLFFPHVQIQINESLSALSFQIQNEVYCFTESQITPITILRDFIRQDNSDDPKQIKKGTMIEMERILIVSALEKELKPVLEALDSPFKPKTTEVIGGREYYLFEISQTRTVICTSFFALGQINAALAVKDAINHFGISKVILTGICAGIDREMKFGDIIISDQIVDYELAKLEPNDVQVRWNVYRSDFALLQGLKAFQSDRWFTYLKRVFIEAKYIKPDVYAGIVLSGNKVIANEKEILRFKQTWAKALAVEMEASGIAAALYQMNNAPSFIMVKAICDFADPQKNDDWQEYAAYASALFVIDYIFSEGASMPIDARLKPASNPGSVNQKLFTAINGTYSMSELNVLAFNIGVDNDDIGGTIKSEKIVELIRYCQRRSLLNKLIEQINRDRDNLLSDLRLD